MYNEIEILSEHQNFKLTESEPLVPSSLAVAAGPDRSAKYTFVPTGRLVNSLREVGWTVARSRQVRVRDEARSGFQKHAVWLRQAGQSLVVGEYVTELILINAHDGSSSYQLHGGIYRTACSNGMVFADSTFESVRFPHRGSTPDKVVDASLRLVADMPRLAERIELFKARRLSTGDAFDFSRAALALRYPLNPPCNPESLLKVRRVDDEEDNLWTVLNRVQENLLRGGRAVSDDKRTPAGRVRSVRPCSGIDRSVNLNRGLWKLADDFLVRN